MWADIRQIREAASESSRWSDVSLSQPFDHVSKSCVNMHQKTVSVERLDVISIHTEWRPAHKDRMKGELIRTTSCGSFDKQTGPLERYKVRSYPRSSSQSQSPDTTCVNSESKSRKYMNIVIEYWPFTIQWQEPVSRNPVQTLWEMFADPNKASGHCADES